VFDGFGAYLRRLVHEEGEPPDFEQTVKVVLATFAVFTGFVFSTYIKDELTLADFTGWLGWTIWFDEWRLWAFFALMALMLRYIIGSAIHLSFMYIPPKDDGDDERPRSQSVFFLFKDLVFLVMFGLIAMSVAAAAIKGNKGSIDVFMQRSMLFVGAGFFWSVSDAALRFLWGRKWPNEKPGFFWIVWGSLDLLQLAATYALLKCTATDLHRAAALAVVYTVFLFLDVKAAIRAVQVHE